MEFRLSVQLLYMVILLNTVTVCQDVPDPNMSCNTCCQGPAGINGLPGPAGIPGSNGNIGSPGRDGRDGVNGREGVKGDSGSKGDKGNVGAGKRGPPGPEGPPGDIGEPGLSGRSGKVGPRGPVGIGGPIGPIGPVGPVGPPGLVGGIGPKGAKGSSGSKGEAGRIRESAFSVLKTDSQLVSSNGQLITFNEVRVNIGGHFDLNTGRFTCQIAGTYYFSYSMYSTGGYPDLQLMKNGSPLTHARTEANKLQLSSSTLVELDVGDQIWMELEDQDESVSGNNAGRCVFSGFLLYEH